jgi:hypothetical protein
MPFLVPSGPVEPDGWLQRLGPIGPIYDEGGRPTSLVVAGASVASPVRVIRPKEMTVNAVKSKLSESDWNFWLAVGSIESAYHEGNLEEVRIQYARLLPVIYGHSKQGAELFAQHFAENLTNAAAYISGIITQTFDEARIVCWRVGKDYESSTPPTFAQGIFCPDYKTALAMQLVLKHRVKLCRHCGTSFAGRPDQKYCSPTCRSTYGVARWRRNQ